MAAGLQLQVEFCRKLIKEGNTRGAILAEFAKKWPNISERTADRRIKAAMDQLADHMQQVNEKAMESISEEVAALKEEILTALERQKILSQIARGEIRLKKPMVVNKEVALIECVPDYNDRTNAIAQLNRMDGSYAPAKVAQTDADGNAVNPTIIQYTIPNVGEVELQS